jgi:hypothetical protein
MKLDEAIAGTLGSLDELEQELIEKQTELANELADVETALSRITAIREAAIGGGKSPKKRDARNDRQRIEENREAVLGHLRTLDEPVRAGAIAEALDRDPRGTGATTTTAALLATRPQRGQRDQDGGLGPEARGGRAPRS